MAVLGYQQVTANNAGFVQVAYTIAPIVLAL